LYIRRLFLDEHNNDQPRFRLLFQLFDQCPKFVFNGDQLQSGGVLLTHELMNQLSVLLADEQNYPSLLQLEFQAPNVQLMKVSECVEMYATQFYDYGWMMNMQLLDENLNSNNQTLLFTKNVNNQTTKSKLLSMI
jgi:hypothetical protein